MKCLIMFNKKSIFWIILIQLLVPNNAYSIQLNSLEKYTTIKREILDYTYAKTSDSVIKLKNKKYNDRSNNNKRKIKLCEQPSIGVGNTHFSSFLIAMSPEEIPKCFPRKIPKA